MIHNILARIRCSVYGSLKGTCGVSSSATRAAGHSRQAAGTVAAGVVGTLVLLLA
jgi:hypothetical protein